MMAMVNGEIMILDGGNNVRDFKGKKGDSF